MFPRTLSCFETESSWRTKPAPAMARDEVGSSASIVLPFKVAELGVPGLAGGDSRV